jgi:universal stress protein A
MEIEKQFVTGTPFVEIVAAAKRHDSDLIVIGTHGRGALAHALIGSVAERVVRKAPCPVLTVRSGTHRFEMP